MWNINVQDADIKKHMDIHVQNVDMMNCLE